MYPGEVNNDRTKVSFTPLKELEAKQSTIEITLVIPGYNNTVTILPVELPRIQTVTRTEVISEGEPPGSGDRTISISATGVDREAVELPIVWCNGLPADLTNVASWSDSEREKLRAAVPARIDYSGEIRVKLRDDLRRWTDEWILQALP